LNKIIWILSDGKAGHLSQTRGLAVALIKRTGGQIREIDLAGIGFFGKLRAMWEEKAKGKKQKLKVLEIAAENDQPHLIISAGHGTHIPLLLCGWLYKNAKTVVCMKPSFPMRWFDFCIVPRHDLSPEVLANPPVHIIPTIGALHGIQPSPESPKTHTLILIGGPSKEYGWDDKLMIGQLGALVQAAAEGEEKRGITHAVAHQNFLLTTSRRTPANFVQMVRNECPAIDVVPVEETPRGWVAEKLSHSKAVWVTKDSVSMIYEALGSGAPVGLLNMIPLKGTAAPSSRVAKGIEMLKNDGWVTSFDIWKGTGSLKSKGALVEVDRVADMLVKLIS
jgi:mitochondrial fission protein ELM1